MLKVKKFFVFLQNILIIALLLATTGMFFVRYKMYTLSKNLAFLDQKIEKLQNNRELLSLELTYLTSTERLLTLIDKNPNILNNKDIIVANQLKSKKELLEISLAKANNKVYENKKVANTGINNLNAHEI